MDLSSNLKSSGNLLYRFFLTSNTNMHCENFQHEVLLIIQLCLFLYLFFVNSLVSDTWGLLKCYTGSTVKSQNSDKHRLSCLSQYSFIL